MCYCRRKTTNRRDDKAYIEIAVPDRLSHLLEKYAGEKGCLTSVRLMDQVRISINV